MINVSFYGWKIVAALFVVLLFSSGLGFYNHAIIVQALGDDPRFSIEAASFAVSIFFFVSGLAGLVIAPVMEKIDIRWIMTGGAALAAASLLLLGRVDNMLQLYLVYSVFGIGYCFTSILPSTTLIARWFMVQRARALSIASTGLSVGGMVVTPVSATLVEQFGFAAAMNWLALFFFMGVVPVTLLLIRSSPAHLGLEPDGQVTGNPADLDGLSFSEATAQHFFWAMSCAFVLIMLAQVGGIAHQFGILSERLTVAEAAVGIAILPAFSIAGRLLGAFILDYFATLRFAMVMVLLQAVALLLIAGAESVYLMYLGFALFGGSVGNLLMLHPLIIAEFYGLKHYSRLFAWSNMIMLCGVAAGPGVMGWLYGYTGSYTISYRVAGALCLAAYVVFFLMRPPAQKA